MMPAKQHEKEQRDMVNETARQDALMFTSMCVWEGLVLSTDQRVLPAWVEFRDQLGTCATRDAAGEIARVIEDAWVSLSQDDRDNSPPFDWELVPAMLAEFGPAQAVSTEEMAAAMQAFIKGECND